MASEQFKTELNNFKINLDEDAIEYIGGMLSDMSLTDHDEVRESTETFLVDANIHDMIRSAFYKSLFSSKVFQGNSTVVDTTPKPVRLSAKPAPIRQKETPVQESHATPATTAKRVTLAEKRAARKNTKAKGETSEEEPVLVAISQQSRFHTETLETTNKEIDLPGVQISINQLDLLVDAHLRLKPLTRYGLVGQNGVGKSILMKCLADNILVGIPQNLNILHISQLEDFDESTTVVEEVLSADKKAAIAIREYEGKIIGKIRLHKFINIIGSAS